MAGEDGDQYLFELAPVFVTADGEVDEGAARATVEHAATGSPEMEIVPPDAEVAFQAAKKHLEGKVGVWDWEDDVGFVSISWVVFK
ncbi:MAG: hypothetical protein ISS52_01585 [Dehalococcoidia bacterium]|nr:hypothetical protein [Dehalococcoidia bacterium]